MALPSASRMDLADIVKVDTDGRVYELEKVSFVRRRRRSRREGRRAQNDNGRNKRVEELGKLSVDTVNGGF